MEGRECGDGSWVGMVVGGGRSERGDGDWAGVGVGEGSGGVMVTGAELGARMTGGGCVEGVGGRCECEDGGRAGRGGVPWRISIYLCYYA